MTDSTADKPCRQCGQPIPRSNTNYNRMIFCGNDCALAARRYTPEQAAAAFWAKVNKTEGCWLWTGAKERWGYGRCNPMRKQMTAHRYAWELTHGVTLTPDQLLLHHCDTPLCVRPDHLWIGTNKDNMVDCQRKGRNSTAQLKPEQVRIIRRLLGTMSQREIAALIGVKPGIICDINKGYTYNHVE